MSAHGSSPEPRVRSIEPVAPESEAAAIVAAVEQFAADAAPSPAESGPTLSPWARAALEEGIAARQVSGYVWGHAPRGDP